MNIVIVKEDAIAKGIIIGQDENGKTVWKEPGMTGYVYDESVDPKLLSTTASSDWGNKLIEWLEENDLSYLVI